MTIATNSLLLFRNNVLILTVLQYILLLTDGVLILAELLSSAHTVDRVWFDTCCSLFVCS